MNELVSIGLLAALWALLWLLRRRWTLRRAGAAAASAPSVDGVGLIKPQSLDLVPGALLAPVHTPSLVETINELPEADLPHFAVPVGWQGGRWYNLVYACLVGDAYHILITGQTGCGKDMLATWMLLTLALCKRDEVALCIIDGKGLDYALWSRKRVVWRLAAEPEEIAPALAALTEERRRRGAILRAAGAQRWEEYPDRQALPLLVVYIAELSLLADALGSVAKLEAWLNPELASGRAFGMRYIIATQTASNFAMRWRSQISLHIAGYQPSASQDEPNTGLTTAALRAARGVPPSELPASVPGVFTAVQGRDANMVRTVRASLVTREELRSALAWLPDRPPTAQGEEVLASLLAEPAEVSVSVSLPSPGVAGSGSSGDAQMDTDTDTTDANALSSIASAPTTRAQRQQRRKIRKALDAGLTVTDIAEIIGGNRNAAFALVRSVAAELEAERAAAAAQAEDEVPAGRKVA